MVTFLNFPEAEWLNSQRRIANSSLKACAWRGLRGSVAQGQDVGALGL